MPMSLPTINTYSVDENKICLTWEAVERTNIFSWNIYMSPTVSVDFNPPNMGVILPGAFTKVLGGIANIDHPMTPNSVYIELKRDFLGLDTYDACYFLITSVDKNGVESPLDIENLHAAPFEDDRFVDEAGWPVNVVYKNFSFSMDCCIPFNKNAFLDITSLLGRPARQVKISALDSSIQIRMNAFNNDTITINPPISGYFSGYEFNLIRGEMQIERIYVANTSIETTNVQIYVAG